MNIVWIMLFFYSVLAANIVCYRSLRLSVV